MDRSFLGLLSLWLSLLLGILLVVELCGCKDVFHFLRLGRGFEVLLAFLGKNLLRWNRRLTIVFVLPPWLQRKMQRPSLGWVGRLPLQFHVSVCLSLDLSELLLRQHVVRIDLVVVRPLILGCLSKNCLLRALQKGFQFRNLLQN